MGNASDKEEQKKENVFNSLKSLKMCLNTEEKIQRRVEYYNTLHNISRDTSLKINKLPRLTNDELISSSKEIVKKICKDVINHSTNISLPQVVLIPDCSSILKTSNENYVKRLSALFSFNKNLRLIRTNSEAQKLFDTIIGGNTSPKKRNKSCDNISNKSGENKNKLKVFIKSQIKNINSNKKTSKFYNTKRDFTGNSPSNKSLDTSLMSKNSNKSNVNRSYSNTGRTDKLTPLKVDVSIEKKLDLETKQKLNNFIIPKESDGNSNTKMINNLFNISPVMTNSKSKANSNSKSILKSTPTINYKLDMKKLVEMYKTNK
jgi:hypothetical protein